MKKFAKVIAAVAVLVLCFSLSACGNSQTGTNFSNLTEMQTNFEGNHYTVAVTTDLGEQNGTRLTATKDGEYLEFYWLDNADDCEYFYTLLAEKYTNYHSLVKIENDEKFGNIVYCGTEQAIDDADIKIVDVKVKV